MNKLINQSKDKYGHKNLEYLDFCTVMDQFAQLDDRCQLEAQILEQLYEILQQKQDGQVTYASIEVLVFDYLILQPVIQNVIQDQDIGPQTKRLSKQLLDRVDQELLENLINFHKLCQSRLQLEFKDTVQYSKIEQIGNGISNQLHFSTTDVLNFISALRDENDLVKNEDIILLINELEKSLYKTQKDRISLRASLQPKVQQPQPRVEIALDINSDQEYEDQRTSKKLDEESISLTNQEKIQHYSNLLFKGLDYFRQQKQIIKMDGFKFHLLQDGPRIIGDMLKVVQKIESKALEPYKWNDEKNKQIEELYIERELIVSQLNAQQDQKRIDQEQYNQILDENDMLFNDLTNREDQIDKLKKQIVLLLEDGKNYSIIEGQVRIKEKESETYKKQTIELDKERNRLQTNNITLLEIIKQLEDQQIDKGNDSPQLINRKTMYNDEQNTIYSNLNEKVQQLEEDAIQLNVFIYKLEGQLQDAKREALNYKNLFDNQKEDNSQFRSSLMRPSINFGGRASNINNRVSNLGNYNLERQSQIGGRNSNTGRVSNIGRISNVSRYQNARMPKSPIYVIEQQQESEISPTLTGKDQLQLIAEEDQDEHQEQQKRSIGVNFGNFWDKYVQPGDSQQKGFSRPGYNPEYKFLEFDENVLYQRDYLGLRDNPKIVEILRLEKIKYNQILIKCFSDAVFRIDAKGQKSRRILFSTEFNIYIFESEKHFKLTRQFPIEKINKIIFSETSPILCCIVIRGSDDYLIETFKRVELNVYLTETLGERKLPLYELDFKTSFEVHFKDLRQPKRIEDLAKGSYMGGSQQSTYKVSQKNGFLSMQFKKLFSKEWQEVFIMLCDVGLILFKKPGDQEPILFVPIADALVIKNPKSVEKPKINMIKICYKTLEQEFVFSAPSPALLDEWHDMINAALNAQIRQQSKQNLDQKSEIEQQRFVNELK